MRFILVGFEEDKNLFARLEQAIFASFHLKNTFAMEQKDQKQLDRQEVRTEDYILFSPTIPRNDIMRLARKLNCSRAYVVSIEFFNGIEDVEKIFIPLSELPYLDTLLVPICDHCNLNCKGCSHFSPLVTEEVFYDFEAYKKDLRRVKELIDYSDRINLLGGEPLLHKEIDKFISYTREIFPFSHIWLVTNGILLRTFQHYDVVRNTDAIIALSVYPALDDNTGQVVEILKKEGVNYILLKGDAFAPMLRSRQDSFPAKTIDEICSNNPMLKRGKIYTCPVQDTVQYFNRTFGTDYPTNSGYIDIYEDAKEMDGGYQKDASRQQSFANTVQDGSWEH